MTDEQLLAKRGDTDKDWRARLAKQANVSVRSLKKMPLAVVIFFSDQISDAEYRVKTAGEHKAFIKSTGVFDMDYYDAGANYDGRLEEVGDLCQAVGKYSERGLDRFQPSFDSWLAGLG